MKLYLDREALNKVARANQAAYEKAAPFPHIVLDGLFPEEPWGRVLEEFPKPESDVWKECKNYHEGKLESQEEGNIGAFASVLLYQFNSAPFLSFLEELTKPEYGGEIVPEGTIFSRGAYTGLVRSLHSSLSAPSSKRFVTTTKLVIEKVTPPIVLDAAKFLLRRR